MTILCSNCHLNQETMSIWMIHLANCHPLPVEWLSEKAKMLTEDENQRPYTVVTDSRKRRRRQTTPRPLNTFMIFSRHIRRNILSVFPDASNSLVSKELGLLWKRITSEIKTCYEEEAKRLAQLHAQEFPTYKYQPKKRIRRYERVIYDGHISPTNVSRASTCTDEENRKDKDNRSSSDIENQYIRYSICGKNLVKECQTFNSPLKNVQQQQQQQSHQPEIKEEEFVLNEISKPFNVRLTNFSDPNFFLKPHRMTTGNSLYIIPSENLVSNSTVISQVLGEDLCKELIFINDFYTEHNLEEEIDITGNIFGNDLDLEWSEFDDVNDRQDLPNLNTLFNH